jgi:hypothetical protein
MFFFGVRWAFMNLIPIEAPTQRMATARQTPKFFNTPLSIHPAGQLSQIVAEQFH